MRQLQLRNAWVIHARSYRDNDLLVDLLTRETGRFCAVLNGGRRRGKTRSRSTPAQPGQKILIAWSGRATLKTLTALESDGPYRHYPGHGLLALLYLNELLYRLLPESDAHPNLFDEYSSCVHTLSNDIARVRNIALRRFELQLLRELGYGIDFAREGDENTSVKTNAYYYFDPTRGFIHTSHTDAMHDTHVVVEGSLLEQLKQPLGNDPECLAVVRRIARVALQHALGKRVIRAYRMLESPSPS